MGTLESDFYSFVVWIFLGLLFILGLVLLLYVLLWQRKRVVDRDAYRDVLNTEEVVTCHDLDDYVDAAQVPIDDDSSSEK